MASKYNNQDIEILVSTMNKKSLDFLVPMFPFSHFSKFSILIINQTQEDFLLTSDYPTIRIINSFEKGLSKSRNLAIKNATKKICLIADDDVIYDSNFEKEILTAFEKLQNVPIITFNHKRIGLKKPQKNFQKSFKHTMKSIREVSSIEIAFLLEDIKLNKIYFNEYFGLGAVFETAEEFLFLREVLLKKMKIYFSPFVIVSHPRISSGMNEGENGLLIARAALFYKIKRKIVYLWLAKYIFFLFRNKYIKKEECIEKFKIGLAGIKKYKEIVKLEMHEI